MTSCEAFLKWRISKPGCYQGKHHILNCHTFHTIGKHLKAVLCTLSKARLPAVPYPLSVPAIMVYYSTWKPHEWNSFFKRSQSPFGLFNITIFFKKRSGHPMLPCLAALVDCAALGPTTSPDLGGGDAKKEWEEPAVRSIFHHSKDPIPGTHLSNLRKWKQLKQGLSSSYVVFQICKP